MSMHMKLKSFVRLVPTAMLVVTFCFGLAACSREQAEGPQIDAAGMAKTQAARQAEEKAKAAIAALSRDELNKLASTAFREQRLYAPAGNNALEYYLALRKRLDEPDPMVENALMDLAPYTVIAAEQAITRMEFDEAARLRNLIAAIDPGAPSLPRISREISDGLRDASALSTAELRRQQETLLAAEQAALKATLEASKPEPKLMIAKPATTTSTSSSYVPPSAAATLPAPAAAPSFAAITSAAITPTPLMKSELLAVRTPEPEFPSDALNRGLSGAVEIEFIVQRSGEVSDVRVVNSNQRAFDRSVVMTVKRWKFAPLAEPRTVRRSFNFSNPG